MDTAPLQAEMHEALAGATADIATQLKSITDEMNRLKSELYSSDGGLGSITQELEKIKQQAAVGMKGPDMGPGAGGGGCRPRPSTRPAERGSTCCSSGRESLHGQAESSAYGDHNPWLDRDRVSGHGEGSPRRRPRPPPQPQPTSWVPYIVGALILFLGPLRPLLWGLLKDLASDLLPAGVQNEPAWYDQ